MSTPSSSFSMERFNLLDAIRGVALLGVLLANMQWHSYVGLLPASEQAALPLGGLNSSLSFLLLMLVDGKFYSIFSLLFGIGFSLIISKQNGGEIMNRRLAILMVIGLVHASLIWDGDILILYALLGFTLPLFNKLKDKTIFIIAGCLLLSPIALDSLRMITDKGYYPETPLYAKYESVVVNDFGRPDASDLDAALWQKHGGVSDNLQYKYANFYYHWAYYFESNRFSKVLGIFLLGLLIGRNKLFAKADQHTNSITRIRNWGFAIGLPTSFMYAYTELHLENTPLVLHSFWYVFSVFPLAFAYTATLTLWYQKGLFEKGFNRFAAVGKIALSVYLSQSILTLFIFSGIGLGLGTQISLASSLFLGLIIFAGQIFCCQWWIKRYQFGPVEWVWRQMTYGKRLSLKRQDG